jgi:TolA-binding protein
VVTVSAPPIAAPAAPAAPVELAASPELLALRDPRVSKPSRSQVLLVTELQNLEGLFGTTAKDSPDRPRIMRKLAEKYDELVRAARRQAAEMEGRGADGQTEAEKARKIEEGALRAVIRFNTLRYQQYPDWCAIPPVQKVPSSSEDPGCADEAKYFAALAYESQGQLDPARRLYLDIARQHPDGRYAPYALLAFGEAFLKEESSWNLAQKAFNDVLQRPAPENPLYGYALLRLGEIHLRLGEQDQARAMFARLSELAAKNPGLPGAQIPAKLIPPSAR